MSDGQKFATLNDLAAVTGLAAPIYTVGNSASGAVYSTVQEAVTEAKKEIDAGTYSTGLVVVYEGTYLEDVNVLCSGIGIVGLGGPGAVVIRSLTWSDASAASITAFNASGTFTDLADGSYTTPPVSGGVCNVTLFRDAAAVAYGSAAAEASLRLLGFDAAAGTFLNTKFIVSDCRILKANGAAAGTGGILGCYGNQCEVKDALITGGCVFEQYASKQFYGGEMLATGVFKDTYNSAGTIPATAYSASLFYNCQIAGEIEVNGDVADFTARNCYIGTIDNNCTAAGSASTIDDCHIAGTFDNANANATTVVTGGEGEVVVTGAGAAGVTFTTRKMRSDMVPLTDNAHDVGTTSMRLAQAHATQVIAHADATDAVKTTIEANGYTTKGTNVAVGFTAAAAETDGYEHTITGGTGGATAGAAAGGAGGDESIAGGTGGAGDAAQLAGRGGNVSINAGAAGAAGAAGGAAGGSINLDAGAKSGAAQDGEINIGTNRARSINLGSGTGTLNVLSTGQASMAGALSVTGAMQGPMKVTPTAATPYNVDASTDNRSVLWVNATAGIKTVQLPLATGSGLVVTVAKADAGANAVNVAPQAGEDISGAGAGAAYALAAQFDSVTVVDVAAQQWLVIAHE
jgi:hypothetical protein